MNVELIEKRPAQKPKGDLSLFFSYRLRDFIQIANDCEDAKWQDPKKTRLSKKAAFSAYLDMIANNQGNLAIDIVGQYAPHKISSYID